MLSKKSRTLIDTHIVYWVMECIRAGQYNGKTTLNFEYRVIKKKKKRAKITKRAKMPCDVLVVKLFALM